MDSYFWHPLSSQAALQDQPLAVQLMGQRLVLWRDGQGQPVLMQDQCPHRGAQLSLGRVQGNSIVCRYHGWRFDSQGQCLGIPAVPSFQPPASHRACTYRVAERHDLLWGCLHQGHQDSNSLVATPPELPPLPTRRLLYGPFDVAVSAPRVVENFLDTAHFAFVHEGWLGEAGHADVPDYAVTLASDGRPMIAGYQAWQPRATAMATGGGWVSYRYEVLGPYCAVLNKQPEDGSPGDGYTMWTCPLDDENCRVWMGHYTADELSSDEQLRDFQLTIFAQDKPVLESQWPKRLPLSGGEVHSAADKLSAAYRRYLKHSGIRCGVC